MQRSRDLKAGSSEEDVDSELKEAQDAGVEKAESEVFFFVAKMFEYLHLELHYPADELFAYLENPRNKKFEKIAKDIKIYIKKKQNAISKEDFSKHVNSVFEQLTKWDGSYREFTDFLAEAQSLTDLIKEQFSGQENSE
ncbi:MAG TPA: hypothetical protein VKK79_22280 [Candidatus Lokiarchaeia archaeon]|nr:hypothetical protein [Candidatus Lokiarchaeia archaeon]